LLGIGQSFAGGQDLKTNQIEGGIDPMNRTASADWNGKLREGEGKLTTQSGTLSNSAYSFGTRFENKVGTNPEELIAAAHAGCFTMALSSELQKMGLTPEKLHTDATVSLEKDGNQWSITQVELSVSGRVPGVEEDRFKQAAELAKSACPVSRLIQARITLQAKLLPKDAEVPLSQAV